MTRWLSMKDACEYAGISRNTMKKLIDDGSVVAGRTVGNHIRIDRESIDKHFSQGEEKSLALLRSLGL